MLEAEMLARRILAAAEQIAFGVAELANERTGRGIADTQLQLAGGLLRDINVQDRPVGLRAWCWLDVDILEEAERANARARAIDQNAVEGIAFHQPEFAPDHLVQRAGVAGDVDLLDVNARSLLNVEHHVDRVLAAIARDTRVNFSERIALGAGSVRQRIDGFVDQLGVVGASRHDRNERPQAARDKVP